MKKKRKTAQDVNLKGPGRVCCGGQGDFSVGEDTDTTRDMFGYVWVIRVYSVQFMYVNDC